MPYIIIVLLLLLQLLCNYAIVFVCVQFVLENMFKKLQPPEVSEGFARVDVLPFALDIYSEEYASLSPITKRLYECFL